MREKAYDTHTYKHTTMGFLKDIQDMPNQYEYSKQFFARYYRPEYVSIVVAGDIDVERTRTLVAKYWGGWKRGAYVAPIPPEPPQTAPRDVHVEWPTATLPWVAVAFKAPAYSDTDKDGAALDLISFLGFSSTSDLYQKLVIREQKVDALGASNADHVDPYLFTVMARVKNAVDVNSVKDQILAALASFRETPVAAEKLETLKKHIRYSFALRLDNSEAIAATLARYVALKRTPETVNRNFELIEQITPEDLQRVARKYFVDNGRTIATLAGGKAK